MKRIPGGLIFLAVSFFFSILLFACAASRKTETAKIVIPADVYAVFKHSCMKCHSNDGGRLPRTRLNFSRWDTYSVSKERKKARMISSVLRKGIMPPKSVRDQYPKMVPTQEQVQLVTGWADSLGQ